MPKKFSFFDWASGKSSARAGRKGSDLRRLAILQQPGCSKQPGCWKGSDLRRLAILAIGLALVVGAIVGLRTYLLSGKDHPHEKGPHGGILIAINQEEPHYHTEVVVEDNGRITLFLFGKDTDTEVAVKPQVIVALVKSDHASQETSMIFRPSSLADKATHFIGRLRPSQVNQHLEVSIDKLEIAERSFSFRFKLPGQPGHGARH